MEGKIKGLDQPVSDYFDEYKEGLASELTVGDLASMSSGMKWNEKYYSVINITSESYFTDDLRSVILRQKIIDKPGQSFRYSSGDTQLLAMVIEKATGTTLSDYLSEKFWKPMGAENNALWQLDSDNYGMEKAYCCIASTARDFARFGKLYINNGKWGNEIILDSSFVELATKPVFDSSPYYGYGWWLYNFEGKKVFTMNGHRGQFVISFPEENIIIVRQGSFNEKGRVSNNSGDLYKYISEGYKLAKSIE
jgi:CubicO group peptidase (beta-lactamase class C family)